jgi:hypothetical protein
VSLPPSHTPLHRINIGFHVLSGSLALLFGLAALLTSKGGRLHRRFGRGFLYTYLVVILTATIGLVAFEFRSFLAVVTLLSFYDVFTGYRALQLRGARPQLPDNIASVSGFCSDIHVSHAASAPALVAHSYLVNPRRLDYHQ